MGIAKSVLLPAGSSGGLEAGAGGNDTVVAISKAYPGEYVFFANELPDIPETNGCWRSFGPGPRDRQEVSGGGDSKGMQLVASIAAHMTSRC